MSAPGLTWKAVGSTRCVHCERRFSQTTDMEVVEVEATEFTGGRKNYSANRPVQVMRRWHVECLSAFEKSNDAYRQEVAAAHEAELAALREAIGMDRGT